jgi:cell division GTPase FtsZ
VNVLLLSTGGGGGNILRSVKTLFNRDLAMVEQTDPAYAARLRSAVAACFLDTNEFSLADIDPEERLLIGPQTTRRLGARHNPDVARQALEESKAAVEALISRYSVVFLIGTGGKGTGAGTMFPLAQIVREQRKLLVPVFVRPSFERHEVDKRRYDHSLAVGQQFDRAGIRLVEILNDRGYDDAEPLPQSTVWERMNRPVARALRGLLYVLWDLSQVDPSDLSTLFAGHGRMRIGFGEIDCANGTDPGDEQVQRAIRECWDNPYYAFGRPAGTSLVCIHGEWSNVVDARIKGGLAVCALRTAGNSSYVPLYARVSRAPRPWGITALFSEDTGAHVPVDVAWSLKREDVSVRDVVPVPVAELPNVPVAAAAPPVVTMLPEPVRQEPDGPVDQPTPACDVPFASLWEFAMAINRGDARALALAAGNSSAAFPIEASEVRKLLGTLWFRAIVPRLSDSWRTRIFEVLADTLSLPNHTLKAGRQPLTLANCTYRQLQELAATSRLSDDVRPDVDLMLMIGRLWGENAVERIHFTEATNGRRSTLGSLLGLRG